MQRDQLMHIMPDKVVVTKRGQGKEQPFEEHRNTEASSGATTNPTKKSVAAKIASNRL